MGIIDTQKSLLWNQVEREWARSTYPTFLFASLLLVLQKPAVNKQAHQWHQAPELVLQWRVSGSRPFSGICYGWGLPASQLCQAPCHRGQGLWVLGKREVSERPQFSLLSSFTPPSTDYTLGPWQWDLCWGFWGAVCDRGRKSVMTAVLEGIGPVPGLFWGFDIFAVEVESKWRLNWWQTLVTPLSGCWI